MESEASCSANNSGLKHGRFRVEPQKQRNVERACDNCRRKKSRCDGSKMPANICSNCIQTRRSCTYVEPSKPRGPPKAYVSNLEDRLEALEYILEQIHPGVDFSDVLGPPVVRDSWKSEAPSSSKNKGSVKTLSRPSLPNLVPPPPSVRRSASSIFSSSEQSTHLIFPSKKHSRLGRKSAKRPSSPVVQSDDETHSSDSSDLSDWDYPLMEQNTFRFYGRSNPLRLVGMAKRLKEQHTIESADPMSDSDYADLEGPSLRRPQFWQIPSWEGNEARSFIPDRELIQDILIRFPPPDLAVKLWDLYFLHVNTQFPLLHRPTLERQWRQRVHHENLWFACVCLSAFAVASRWCDDPRVLPKFGDDAPQHGWTKAGWDFYDVAMYIHQVRQGFFGPASLFELQALSLLAMFIRGTSQHTVGWLLVGSGVRKAQDVGAHRKHQYNERPTVNRELWKRAFWLLVSFDRISSAALGRNCGVGEEDFDLDLPTEVDDEYWEPTESRIAFTQPPNLPSQVTAFNLWVKLSQVIAFTLRAIYGVNNSQIFFGKFSLGNVEQIISQLDAALEKWLKSVPSHLKWSKEIEDPIFANQSATLYTTYYLTQMLIYRPFIPRPRVSTPSAESASPFGLSALRICTDAAKACVPIIKHQMRRGISNVPNLISVAHISAALLLINVWDLKGKECAGVEDMKPPIAQSIDLLLDDINIFLSALEWAQHRFEVVVPVLKSLRASLPSSDEETNRQNAVNFTKSQQFAAEQRKQGFKRQPSAMASEHRRPMEGWPMPVNGPLLRQKSESAINDAGPKTEAKSYRAPPVKYDSGYAQNRPVDYSIYPPPSHPPPPSHSQSDYAWTPSHHDYHYSPYYK